MNYSPANRITDLELSIALINKLLKRSKFKGDAVLKYQAAIMRSELSLLKVYRTKPTLTGENRK